jgi:hypothetical protein
MACLVGFFSIVARPVVVVFMRDPSIAAVGERADQCIRRANRDASRNCLMRLIVSVETARRV